MGEAVDTMHIGELAEKTGLSLRTLRHYDEIGLVTATGRTEGGFRLYTERDVDRLMLIRRMKPLGFSLEQMIELLETIDAVENGAGGSEKISAFVDETIERRETLRAQLTMADEFLELLQSRHPSES